MKFVAYIRQSKEKDGGLSPESQREAIDHWASTPGKDREVIWLKPDLDLSGKSLERPSVQEALRLVREGGAKGIVVSKLDRLTRSVVDLNRLIEEAKEGGWTIIALDLGVDLHTANGKLFAGIIGVISEWYLDRLREETARTLQHKIEVDGAHWGAPPLGYLRGRTVNERGQDKPGALVVDERWAPVVQEVFRRRALPNGERASWRDLALYLTAEGAPGLYERAKALREKRESVGSKWNDTSVRAIIQNRAYLGEAKAGSRVKRGAHPVLVDETTFRRANRKGTLHGAANRRGGPLLGGGLLRCGSCGGGLYKSSMKTGHWFYRCRAATCTARPTISARKIEEYLVREAFGRFEPFESQMTPYGKTPGGVDIAEVEAKLAQIDADIEEVEADETLSEYRKAKALTALDAEREELLDRIASAEVETKVIGPEYLGLVFQLKGDHGLRKEQTPDGGYKWVPDPEAEGHWLDNLSDVKACREFIREMLGERVTVLPANGSKTIPVEERVRLAGQSPST